MINIPYDEFIKLKSSAIISLTCDICGKLYNKTKKVLYGNNRKIYTPDGFLYKRGCSKECRLKLQRKRIQKICKCGKSFEVQYSDKKQYCSNHCANSNRITSNITKEKIRNSINKYYKNHPSNIKYIRCIKCNIEFPARQKINDKYISFYARSLCLNCLPYSDPINNPKTFIINNILYKICKHCNKTLAVNSTNFYKSSKRSYTVCKSCAKRLASEKFRNIKYKCVEYKGGKCNTCGYNKHPSILDFHHLDPNSKKFTIGSKPHYTFEQLKKEIDKCILLCSNCHREYHAGMLQLPINI